MLSKTLNSPPRVGGVPSKRGGGGGTTFWDNTPSAALVPLTRGTILEFGQLLYHYQKESFSLQESLSLLLLRQVIHILFSPKVTKVHKSVGGGSRFFLSRIIEGLTKNYHFCDKKLSQA